MSCSEFPRDGSCFTSFEAAWSYRRQCGPRQTWFPSRRPDQNAWYAIGASEDIPEPQLREDLLDDRKPIAPDDQKEVDAELARPEVRLLLGAAVGVSQLPHLAEPYDLKADSSADSFRMLSWRRWVALSTNRRMGRDPAAALGRLCRLYSM